MTAPGGQATPTGFPALYEELEALESRLDSAVTTLLAKVHKLEDQLDVMRNWQGWAENNVLCGHACRIETLEERVTGVVANTDAEVDNLIRGLNTLIKRVNRMDGIEEDDDELRS